MAKLFHVAIGFANKTVSVTKIQDIFGTAGWARYAPNCWIVETSEAPQALANRLRSLCDPTDSIFICELNAQNNGGYLQKEVWDWINQRKLNGR